MAKKTEAIWLFSTEEHGFNKDQVMESIGKIYSEYEKIFDENVRLKKSIKSMKIKLQVGTVTNSETAV